MVRDQRPRLIIGLKNRDPKRSFERRYRDSYSLVYNYVYRRVPNREACEDVVAEAFLRAARFYGNFDESRAKFSTWVISIARNCISDYYERNVPSAPLDEVPEGFYSEESTQYDNVGDAELVSQLMALLSDEEREMVFLKYYQGLRNVEIAEELGMNVSTVSTKLSRAMSRMRAAV